VKVVRESPGFELVGICEDSAKIREPYADMNVSFITEEALLKECAVVAVESAVRDHARHARLALEAGKHVHVEKPPADSLPAFQQLVTLARDKKLLFQAGYMWRYNPGIVAALEAARKGWLGQIYLVRGTINTTLPADRRSEWAEFKGGTLFELGCHLVDSMVRLLGRPNSVTPFLHKHGNFTDNFADNTVAVFGFGNATGIITSAALGPNAGPHRFFEILGTSGTALLKPIEPPTLQIDLAKAAGAYAAGNQSVKFPPYRRYVGDFAELAEAVRAERPLSVSLEEELAVQETLIRACEM
jgi:predicted dehydrogenase